MHARYPITWLWLSAGRVEPAPTPYTRLHTANDPMPFPGWSTPPQYTAGRLPSLLREGGGSPANKISCRLHRLLGIILSTLRSSRDGRPKTSNKTGRDVYNSPSQKGDNNPHLLNTNCAPFSPKSGEGKWLIDWLGFNGAFSSLGL